MGICVCMYYVSMCVCARMCLYIIVCVWLRVTAIRTRSVRSRSVTGDSELCSLWTRYTSDSKIDSWDDPEVCTDLCNEYQMVIWTPNRVISCECLFLCISLFTVVNSYLCFTCIISYDHLIYLTMYDYSYHFI